MQRIRVSGPEQVAAALRAIADGVAAGRIRVGEGSIACSAEVSAVIEMPDGETVDAITAPQAAEVSALTVLLHPRGQEGHRHLGIEQELTHPGG